MFSKLLEVSRMHQSLKETYHTITALVPTDHALQHISQDQLRRIMSDETLSKGTMCNKILLMFFSVRQTHCKYALMLKLNHC